MRVGRAWAKAILIGWSGHPTEAKHLESARKVVAESNITGKTPSWTGNPLRREVLASDSVGDFRRAIQQLCSLCASEHGYSEPDYTYHVSKLHGYLISKLQII
jgi:hypothetical protein